MTEDEGTNVPIHIEIWDATDVANPTTLFSFIATCIRRLGEDLVPMMTLPSSEPGRGFVVFVPHWMMDPAGGDLRRQQLLTIADDLKAKGSPD